MHQGPTLVCRSSCTVLAFLALTIFAPLGVTGESAKRPVTFEDLDGVKNDGTSDHVSLDLSADGRLLAAERGRQLRIFDAKTGKLLADVGDGILPLFSPSGEALAFYSNRSGAMQIWVRELRTGKAQPVTDLTGGVDPDVYTRIFGVTLDAFRFDWSPDGAKIVFASRIGYPAPRPAGAPLVLDNTTPADLTLSRLFADPSGMTGGLVFSADGRAQDYRAPKPQERLVSRLFVVDVRTHALSEVEGGSGHLFHPAWSPDGGAIAYAAVAEDSVVFSARAGELRVLELATGRIRTLAAGDGIKNRPRWSRDGSQLAYLTCAFAADPPSIKVADPRSAEQLREIRPGLRIRRYDWSRDGNGFLLSYDDGSARLGRIVPEESAPARVASDVGPWWAQSRDGTLAWINGLSGSDVWLLPKAASAPRKRVGLAQEEEGELQLGRSETFVYRNAGGFTLRGKLLYPLNYVEGRRYPLIVDAYPMSRGDWMHHTGGNHAWSARGYLVFKPYARAPHVWGSCAGDADFCRGSRGPAAWDAMVDDVMSGVDALIAGGLADSEHMCVHGHSNGGGVVSYLVTQTDRFRCAVILAPVFPSWVGAPSLTGAWDWMVDRTGIDPFEDPAAYIELSAIFQVKNVKTPVLMAAGDRDGVFLLGAIEMYNALRFAGKQVTFLRYPDQRHVFQGAALRDFWNREMEFLALYLKPQSPAITADRRSSP